MSVLDSPCCITSDLWQEIQFKPGRLGYPARRPRKKPIADRLAELLELPLSLATLELLPRAIREQCSESASYADALVIALFEKGMTGNVAAVREVREAVEGKAGKR